MASLGSLVIQIAADTGLLSRDMGRAAAIVERNSRRMQNTLSAVFAGFTGAGFVAFVKKSLDAAAAQKEVAESVGLSVTALSELKYAAGQNGVEFEALSTALVRFNNVLADGVAGKKEAVELLERLGVPLKGLRDGSVNTQQALAIVADRIAGMPDGFQKSALAVDAFGKSGAALIPTLNGGSKGLEEFARQGRNAGAVLDGVAAKAAQKATDKLRALHDEIMTKTVIALAALTGARPDPFGEEIEDATKKMRDLREELHRYESGQLAAPSVQFVDDLRNQYIVARKEVERFTAAQRDALGLGTTPKPKTTIVLPPKDTEAAERAAKKYREETERLLKTYDEIGTSTRQLSADQVALFARLKSGAITWEQYQAAIDGVSKAYSDLGASDWDEDIKKKDDTLSEFTLQAQRNIQGITASLIKGEHTAKSFGQAVVQTLADIAAELLATRILETIFGKQGQDGGFSGGWISGILNSFTGSTGSNANGGFVGAGGLYKVNERGPEMLSLGGQDFLMMGSQHGQVLPSVEGGGARVSVKIENRYDNRGMGPAEQANFIRAVEQANRVTEQRVYESIRRGYAPVPAR